MKKTLVPLIVAVVVGFITYLITKSTIVDQAQQNATYETGLKDLQLVFLKNNAILKPILDMQQKPDLQKYISQVNQLATWYFNNPAKEFWKQYPDRFDPQNIIKDYRKMAEEEGPKQKNAKANLTIREECFELANSIYQPLKSSNYKVVASLYDGSVRFDVVDVKLEDNKLKWIFVAWGGTGTLVYGGWNLRMYKSPTSKELAAFEKEIKRAQRRGYPVPKDPNLRHFAEAASASKSPTLPPFEGSTYIEDFPAGASINYFYTPSCPQEAEELEIKFHLRARAAAGEDQPMEFVFRLPVDSAWKGNWTGVRKIEAAGSY